MASNFVSNLKQELAKHVPGIPIKIYNSPKAQYDTSRTIAICYGKRFTRDLRIKDDMINSIILSKRILNDHCVFIFTKNTTEIVDWPSIDLSTYAPKTGRWISKYGFTESSSCTVCFEDGICNGDMVICDRCQAPVCVPCFAKCVRSLVVTQEDIPPEFKCPTCSKCQFTCEMLGKELVLRPTGGSFQCQWDMIDHAVSSIDKIPDDDEPRIYITHPHMPFNFVATLEYIDEARMVTDITTRHYKQVHAMMTTPGTLICVGDIPNVLPCGRESHHRSGPRDITNGKAYIYEKGLYTELHNGFPIVLSCFYNM